MHRIIAASFLGLALTVSPALAADDTSLVIAPVVSVAAAALVPADLLTKRSVPARSLSPRRPMLLPALYASSAALQGYDAYSTLTVLKHGGVEANPMMKALTKSPALFIGLKAGMATMSMMAAEKMWKNNNRIGAVLTMVASNGLMAYVAANNARVLGQVSR